MTRADHGPHWGWIATITVTFLIGALAVLLFTAPTASAATCSQYDTQADAQRAGDTRDADGDGVYCESLPCPCLKPGQGGGGGSNPAPAPTPTPKPSCKRVDREIKVKLPAEKYPNLTDHIRDAIKAGQPRHLTIDRPGAKKNRQQALEGIPTKKGFQRDEYPPSVSAQGGTGADVRLIPSSENSSSGASMGQQLRPYCNKQRFRLITP